MDNVLLIDTNFSSWPIYHYLESRCKRLFVIGKNKEDCLAKVSESFVNVDYSDIDALIDVIDRFDIDHVVPGCNDLSYLVSASVNIDKRFSGIDSVDSVNTLFNKRRFREFAWQNDLPVPRLYSPEEALDAGAVIVKPVDAYSGRGVSTLRNVTRQDIDAAVQKALSFSRSGQYVIESFIDGQLFSHSAFIKNGTILVDFFVEEHCFANPFVVDTSWVRHDIPADTQALVRSCIEKIAKLLSLTDGLVHTQFIESDGSIHIIEITRRCPGDLYGMLIQMATGFPYVENYANPFIGESFTDALMNHDDKKIVRHTISSSADIRLSGLRFSNSLRISRYIPLVTTGDFIKASPFGRVGLLFASCDSNESRNMLVEDIRNRRLYELESGW